MINSDTSAIQTLSVHFVGNKLNGDILKTSKRELRINDNLGILLTDYFLSSFKTNEFFNLYHDSDLNQNTVYACAEKIFETPEMLHEHSITLAKHLYEQGVHPKIKNGEFYAVYFQDCVLAGERADAIGLFKSENKDTFLKVNPNGDNFDIESEQGINTHKLDKGCLIFNTEKENGYLVLIVDNANKVDAQYWVDEFLQVRQRKDEFYNTQNVMTLCKHFVQEELPQHFEVTKADQADMLNKSVKFLKENDSFDLQEFTEKVITQPEVIKSFKQYKNNFQSEFDLEIADNFDISESAVKKQARTLKSVIKLDKNFHIYIHGNRELIEQGTDDQGRFYKIYFKEEN